MQVAPLQDENLTLANYIQNNTLLWQSRNLVELLLVSLLLCRSTVGSIKKLTFRIRKYTVPWWENPYEMRTSNRTYRSF